MALWLELIPKIHRSDQLDRRFHLLDDFDNATTFERYGTRELPPLDQPFVDDDDSLYFTTTSATATTSTSAVLTSARTLTVSLAVRRLPPVSARRTSTPPRLLATTPRRSNAVAVSGLAVVELATANVPLSATVAVGCTLLLLNVVVFVVVCRQKRRARLKLGAAAARFRSRDHIKHGGGNAGTETDSAGGFESNRSSVSSYSLAASVQQGDYGRCRNVRFCETRASAGVMTSQDGGGSSSVFATRRLPARPGGRENEAAGECLENDLTSAPNHLSNPSTTV